VIGDRWGATDDELARRYPCDDLVAEPVLAAWRAVIVNAAPDQIWPWLIQVRLAPYSYDWIDNFGRRSPRQLKMLDDPEPGDPFTASAGRPLGRVLAVEREVHLTGRIMGVTMTYQLLPSADGTTRLVLKLLAPGPRVVTDLLCIGDLVMARRQLRNFKKLAEVA
jgi:hypothetical protein